MMLYCKVTGLFSLCLFLLITPFSVKAELPIFDSHLHYGDEDFKVFTPQKILEIFDQNRITHALVSSTPNDGTEQLYKAAPQRIIPFLGLYQTLNDKRGWMLDEHVITRVEEALKKGFYRGLGEFHIFAKDKKSPVLKRVVALAEEHNLMLQVHGDAEVIDEIFLLAPSVTVLWAHMGTQPEANFLRAVLQRHPERLYIDTSVRDKQLLENGTLSDEWKALFIDYQDRFLVAVDTFSVNRWQTFDLVVKDIRQWLSFLPESVAKKLAYENAQKLFLDHEKGE